jgi:TonB family protein
LPFRSTDNSLSGPWVISSALHGILFSAVAVLLLLSRHSKPVEVDIRILESPKAAEQPVRVPVERAVQQPKREVVHEVFGISPKAITTTEPEGEAVKAGNTVAKAPDQEILKPGDPEALPVPSDEYLVTNMPALKSEVRVPYPPASRKQGIQGAVVMDLLIDTSGKVRDVTLIESPNSELGNAAVTAARAFQFTPALIREKPVAVKIRYVYRFVLER